MRILLLGGTSEASQMARVLADSGIYAVFSYAGRTAAPVTQPLPTRIGGFGGVAGLAAYLRAENITHVIDATHPFAARMSTNAVAACAMTGVALCALERPPWRVGAGDKWMFVPDTEAAVLALPDHPARVFLAIGRQTLDVFIHKPQHFYLLRLVDRPEAPLPLLHAQAVIARGPFTLAEDLTLLREHGITHIVAKNAGGAGARAKLDAARELGLPVILIDRPVVPPRTVRHSTEDVMHWLVHGPEAVTARGV
ncbi:MAG: cobalt-precorrin-6A reductase [Acetobacter peroxydans]|jgi:precorrin-6A/cobalt-precorrin-6A reductase|nr:cobalt-precorrin-6A reductase [Acetobacter peroxydans]MCI2078724.1 cobalt-precorrin-6A reductase [Acetobacter peroxydans]